MIKSPFSFSIEKTKKNYTVVSLSYTPQSKKRKPMTVKIAPELGSNMFSWTRGDDEIIVYKKDLLETHGFTGNFVLFPTPNRVRDFIYTWKGERIRLKKQERTVQIHGLVFDEAWSFKKPHVTNDSATFTTWIEITKKTSLFEAFPFPCRLTLEYTLYSNKIHVQYTVKNTGNRELPFGFALHPYFNRLSGNDNTYISVPANSWMESPKDTLLPTGKLISVTGKPYDIRKPKPVGALNLDHVYTGLIPKRYPQIDYKTHRFKILLKISNDFTHVVVYTGDKDAVCIENQTCSTDAHNLWGKGLKKESHLLIIAPHKSKNGYVQYVIQPY